MITCELIGGLGNQLFQIYTTIAYSIDSAVPFKLPLNPILGNRHTYWDSFFKSATPFLVHNLPQNIYHEPAFAYCPLPSYRCSVTLSGYFQSYKYFMKHKETITKLLGIRQQQELIPLQDSISMHFRRGDYKKIPDYHPLLGVDYYTAALQQLETQTQCKDVLYFCEDEDIDDVQNIIRQLPQNFTYRRCDASEDYLQLLWMSRCKYNIIANSTFSWWGAYLGRAERVLYPKVWFGMMLQQHDIRDLCPPDWVGI